MRLKGRITEWNDDRGFGFVHPATGGDRVFIHIRSFANRQRRPVVGEIVTYEFSSDRNGRPQGMDVAYSGDRSRPAPPPGPGVAALVFTTLFLIAVTAAVVIGDLPPVTFAVYVLGSGITFVAYWWDKAAARNNDWRTAEGTLHLLGLVGGWPGALVAQKTLRHKSRKRAFQIVFWTTVVFNCCALILVFVQVRAGRW